MWLRLNKIILHWYTIQGVVTSITYITGITYITNITYIMRVYTLSILPLLLTLPTLIFNNPYTAAGAPYYYTVYNSYIIIIMKYKEKLHIEALRRLKSCLRQCNTNAFAKTQIP